MLFLYHFVLLAAATAVSHAQETRCCAEKSTTVQAGTCLSTSSCGTYSIAGACPGAADIQCCINQPCFSGGKAGTCKSTTKGCSGQFVSGACPGDSSVQCCLDGGVGPGFAAFDISDTKSADFWTCSKTKADKVLLRAYRQACGESGGQVDSAFLTSYNAARKAGFTKIDAYLFPCTGTQDSGKTCKQPSTQVSELETFITNNNMAIGTIWLDIEPTTSPCKGWQEGSTNNMAIAKQFIDLARKSKYKWGVYSRQVHWQEIFGSYCFDLASDLPLWMVQNDQTSGVNTGTKFFGKWSKAAGKQYDFSYDNHVVTQCGSGVDLDSFLS